jgi:hypothetical protein
VQGRVGSEARTKLLKRTVAAVVVAGLTACATQNQPGTTGYTAVPEAQFLGAFRVGGVKTNDSARVVVKRDSGFMGSFLSSVLLINSERIAAIRPGQYLELSLAPDEYIFGVSWSDDLGALATSAKREITVECKAGKTYYIRMFPQPGSGIVIERASQ